MNSKCQKNVQCRQTMKIRAHKAYIYTHIVVHPTEGWFVTGVWH